MSGANYEYCPGCDTKALYTGEEDMPADVVILHKACQDRAIAEAVTAERERIQRLGASPLAGKCAYEAFAAVTRQSLNLPPWESIPPDFHVDWQATADAVLMLADLLRDHP